MSPASDWVNKTAILSSSFSTQEATADLRRIRQRWDPSVWIFCNVTHAKACLLFRLSRTYFSTVDYARMNRLTMKPSATCRRAWRIGFDPMKSDETECRCPLKKGSAPCRSTHKKKNPVQDDDCTEHEDRMKPRRHAEGLRIDRLWSRWKRVMRRCRCTDEIKKTVTATMTAGSTKKTSAACCMPNDLTNRSASCRWNRRTMQTNWSVLHEEWIGSIPMKTNEAKEATRRYEATRRCGSPWSTQRPNSGTNNKRKVGTPQRTNTTPNCRSAGHTAQFRLWSQEGNDP